MYSRPSIVRRGAWLLLAAAGLSCEASFPTQPTAVQVAEWTPPAPIAAIELSSVVPYHGRYAVGSSFSFSTAAVRADGVREPLPSSAITWTSSNPAVVRLTTGSGFQAVSPGSADLIVAYQGFTAAFTVTVTDGRREYPRLELVINAPDLVLSSRARVLYPASQFANVEEVAARAAWASSNPEVATVVAGEVSGRGHGFADISASYNGVTASARLWINGADRVSLDRVNPGVSYRTGTTVSWTQRAVMTLGSAPTGTFHFALVDQDDRVLSARPWPSLLVGKPGATHVFSSSAMLPAGTTRVCSQVLLVTETGVRRTFAGTCNEVQ